MFAPDIHRGQVRKVMTVVENPNSFEVEKEIELGTSDKVALGFMEERIRKVVIGPNDEKRVSWRLLGVKQGTTNVSVNGKEEELKVSNSLSMTERVTTGEFFRKFGGVKSKIKVERNPGLEIEWRTPKGTVKITESSSWFNTSLKTSEFSVSTKRSSGKILKKVKTQEGSYRSSTENGVKTEEDTGSIEPGKFFSILKEEVKKLEKIENEF